MNKSDLTKLIKSEDNPCFSPIYNRAETLKSISNTDDKDEFKMMSPNQHSNQLNTTNYMLPKIKTNLGGSKSP